MRYKCSDDCGSDEFLKVTNTHELVTSENEMIDCWFPDGISVICNACKSKAERLLDEEEEKDALLQI